MDLPKILTVRGEPEFSSEVGGPQKESEREGAEVTVRRGEYGFAQRVAHPDRADEITPRDQGGEAPAQPHVQGREPGGLGPRLTAFSDPQSQRQKEETEDQRDRLDGGMDKRAYRAQIGFSSVPGHGCGWRAAALSGRKVKSRMEGSIFPER